MIKAIIFDLDNCLAAADEVGAQLLEPTFEAIRRANDGRVPNEELERAFAACWRTPLDKVARDFGFSQAMLAAGWKVNARAKVMTAMRGYGDLDVLATLSALLFLVTSGFRRLQESKVDALCIKERFERVYIDAIDEPDRKGKEGIFRDILADYELSPSDVLVVGDSAESEIAAGNRIGMPTAQILRPGVHQCPTARHFIASLDELPGLLRSITK
jgi:FMN phosphatase YigB (HAD superfamily)